LSAYNLGCYYQYSEINYDLMKKYYEIGIHLKYKKCVIKLEAYYQHTEKNCELFKKYCMIGIELGINESAFTLGKYYRDTKNYILIKKYFNMYIIFDPIRAYNDIIDETFQDNTLSTTYFFKYLSKYPTNIDKPYDHIIIEPIHKNKILNLVAKSEMQTVNYIFACAEYIDSDIFERILEIIKYDITEEIKMYINRTLSYNIFNKFQNYLTSDNKNMLKQIDALAQISTDCNICEVSNVCVIFSCHVSHAACKSCALKLQNCPYCRIKLFTF
jgi:hypothetical protein